MPLEDEADEVHDVSGDELPELSDLFKPSKRSTHLATEHNADGLSPSNQDRSLLHKLPLDVYPTTKIVRISAGKTRMLYPVGFSIHPVANSGKRPACQGCRHEIDRGCQRLVCRVVLSRGNGGGKIFTDTSNYHCNIECLEAAHVKEGKARFKRA